jgi:hypothetical protein
MLGVRTDKANEFLRAFDIVHCYRPAAVYDVYICGRQPLLHDEQLQVVGRLDKRHPGSPGGRLQSKPTWLNAFRRLTASAFFCRPLAKIAVHRRRLQRSSRGRIRAFKNGKRGGALRRNELQAWLLAEHVQ